MLKVQNLGYRVGERWLLRGVDLAVGEGEFLAVLGPNGSGKTTLLRLLAGELRPTEGEVFLLGEPLAVYGPQALARQRAVLSQVREMAFPYTAYEVAFLGRLPHLVGRERPLDHRKTLEALERVRALSLKERLFPSLSGGEAMRVEVARLLNQEARLLLDEPTASLDLGAREALRERLLELKVQGVAMVGVFHHPDDVRGLVDRQYLLVKEGDSVAVWSQARSS